MIVMLTHAVLAAGRGTRMFGPSGGNKALAPVAGAHLIDYVIREAESLTPRETVLLVRGDDVRTPARVRELTGSCVTVVNSPSDGTGPGVRRLLSATNGDVIALTTCDLAAPSGSLVAFFREALTQLSPDAPNCVVAVSPRDESDPVPIFVHLRDGEVVDYGKRAPRSPFSFAGARVMNEAFAKLLLNSDASLSTDTEMMSAIVREYPGALRALVVYGLFDVDDTSALERAEALTRADRHA